MSVIPIETWERMGFNRDGLIDLSIRLSAANKGSLRVLGRTPIIALSLGERNLWMSFLVVENVDESDQFILGRDFIRNFDVTIDLNNAMFRIRNPEKKYVIKPVNLIMANENKAPVFLSRRVRLKANEAAIVSLRMKNYKELSDDKQVCIIPNPNSQSAAVLGRSFSITKSGLCVSVLLNTLDNTITIQRERKLGYALPVKTRYKMTENVKENEVLDCPSHFCNATATFQRLIAHALIGVTKKYDNLIKCYVDDVVNATPTLEDHIERLDEVFACMKGSGLKCKPSKCEILKDSIKYLGRMVDRHGIRPDPDAEEAVLTWELPETEHQLMSFLGFANYYREFIKGYADKVYPMQQPILHKGKKFTWNNAAEESFR